MVSLGGIGESFESFARYVEILRDPLCANLVGVKTRDFPVDFPKMFAEKFCCFLLFNDS